MSIAVDFLKKKFNLVSFGSTRQSSSVAVLWSHQSACRVSWHKAFTGWIDYHMENAGITCSVNESTIVMYIFMEDYGKHSDRLLSCT